MVAAFLLRQTWGEIKVKDRKTINTGIRLTPSQYARLATLAQAMGVKRNHVFGVLIDNAEVKPRSVVEVALPGKTNRYAATNLAETGSTAVSA